MTCPDCGSPIKHGMTVCPVCGREVRPATVTKTVARDGLDYEVERTVDFGDEDPGLRYKLFEYSVHAAIFLGAVAFVVLTYLWWF